MSSFQSVATAIAAQVGTGNLAGAATAIAMGGPGAIFWMWIAAFFGMATIFAEAVLAQVYRTRDDAGHITGGPAYYISKGLGSHKLAVFFSVSIIIALGCIGNMVQSNSIADAFKTAFDVPPLVMGLIIAACGAFVFFGGIGRIAAVTEKMVPLMALLYVIGGLFVVLSNADQIIPAFKMIFVGAFDPSAAHRRHHRCRCQGSHPLRCGPRPVLQRSRYGLDSSRTRSGKGQVPPRAGRCCNDRRVYRYFRCSHHDRTCRYLNSVHR